MTLMGVADPVVPVFGPPDCMAPHAGDFGADFQLALRHQAVMLVSPGRAGNSVVAHIDLSPTPDGRIHLSQAGVGIHGSSGAKGLHVMVRRRSPSAELNSCNGCSTVTSTSGPPRRTPGSSMVPMSASIFAGSRSETR
jgi:hypothetical protein